MKKNSTYNILPTIHKLREYAMDSLKEHYKDFDLTGSQSLTIHILVRKGKQKITDLAKSLGLSNSTVSGIVDRLEKKEVLIRKRDKKDRRVVYVDLSEKQKALMSQRMLIADNLFEILLEDLSEDEKNKISEGFSVLEKVLENKLKEKKNNA